MYSCPKLRVRSAGLFGRVCDRCDAVSHKPATNTAWVIENYGKNAVRSG